MKITVETDVAAPVEQVWRAYTHPRTSNSERSSDDWHTPAATVDLPGRWRLFLTHGGKDGSMGFDFAETIRRSSSTSSSSIRSATVRRSRVYSRPEWCRGARDFDSEPTHSVEQQRAGWLAILNQLSLATLRRSGRSDLIYKYTPRL